MRRIGVSVAGFALVGAGLWGAPAASAFHDFTSCPNALTQTAPSPPSAATVFVSDPNSAGGFFGDSSGSAVTTIRAGQSVSWVWHTPNCHSVTFGPTPTSLGPSFVTGSFSTTNPELRHPQTDPVTRANDNAVTLTFSTPGRYTYYCVHHWYLGMVGVVQVNPY